TPPSEENLARFCSVDKAKVLHALLWLCANNPVYRSVSIDYSVLDSWPDNHIPQEIRDAFIALGSEAESTQAPVTDEREGYATSLQGGLFENDLDAEVDDAEPGSSSVHPHRPPHVSYQTARELPLINSYTDPDYFTAAFPTLFPFGIGG
ncbi:hypothetical protein B0J14DRAFT_444146, partial [Halenospora varia]